MGKMFVMINGILNNERLHLINFIWSFGQGFASFLYPLLITFTFRWICFDCTLVIIGAMILHIIPITLLIVKRTIELRLMRKVIEQRKLETQIPLSNESRYSDISAISFDFCADIKYPSDIDMENLRWKNPCSIFYDPPGTEREPNDDHFLENLDSNRVMNADGVEIMQIIVEEDEDNDIKFPEHVAIESEELTKDAIESIYDEINRKHELQKREQKLISRNQRVKTCVANAFNRIFTTLHRQIINPLARSLKLFNFYPSIILKSCDIFSYLLFINFILPNLAQSLYRFENRESIIYLIMLMGFCWITYSLLVLKFYKHMKHNSLYFIHIIGILAKFFGYLREYSTIRN